MTKKPFKGAIEPRVTTPEFPVNVTLEACQHTTPNAPRIPFEAECPVRHQERDRTERPEVRRDALSVDSLESVIVGGARERSRVGEAMQILTGKLLQAQEEERRRIARDLHDGLNQQLAVLAIELGMLARQVPKESPVILEQLLSLRDRTEALSNDLRQVTHQLHPAVLEHLGLISALRSQCVEFSQREGIHAWFAVEQELGPVPFDVAICLYRIAQEVLRNVSKHSGAREAWVKITRNPDTIRLSIVDKGVGFNRDAVREIEGLGLVSIQERVQMVKGQLTVRSAPNEGTRIEVQVPITWKEQKSEHAKKHGKAQVAAG